MVNKWYHCSKCGNDWEERDLQMVIEQSPEYQNATDEEKVKCPNCNGTEIT